MERLTAILTAAISISCILAQTQDSDEVRLTPGDGMPLDRFGSAVAINGDFLIIGAPGHNGNGANFGAAYLFRNESTTWTEVTKLLPADGAASDFFGSSVAIDGEFAVVSAYEKDDVAPHSGAVYVFMHDGSSWIETTKLFSPDISQNSHFGESVSISDKDVVVGATGIDKQHTGFAQIFRRDNATEAWFEVTNFFTPDIGEGDNFGSSLTIRGDYLITGDENCPVGIASGIAYIFERQNGVWNLVERLNASDAKEGDQFGWKVSIDGDFAIIGAPGNDESGAGSGATYIFQRQNGSWAEVGKLSLDDITAGIADQCNRRPSGFFLGQTIQPIQSRDQYRLSNTGQQVIARY